MSTKTTVGILVALVALLGVFYWVTNLGTPRLLPPPPKPTSAQMWARTLEVACKPVRGNRTAPWTVIEIGDFQCPICGTSRKYVEALIDKSGGQANLYFLNYPLEMHEFARSAAIASLAAEKQGKFWPMYDQLYLHQENLSPPHILMCAKDAGLNMSEFVTATRAPVLMARLGAQHVTADSIGVQATPTFLVHKTGTNIFDLYIGMWPQNDFGDKPGLRQLAMNTPWGVKMPSADIPPAKSQKK